MKDILVQKLVDELRSNASTIDESMNCIVILHVSDRLH